MTRREARKIFEQTAQTGYVQHENYEMTLRAQVEERLREREREDSELAEMVHSFNTTIDNMREFLIRNSADDTPRPVPDAYKVMLRDEDSATEFVPKELEDVFYKRNKAGDAQAELEGLYGERMSAIEALKRRNEQDKLTEPDIDQEEGLDMDSLKENDGKQHRRGDPLHWQVLLREDIQVNIADGVEECDAAMKEERVAFLSAFVAHTNQAISGLKC
ncbi:uncharacterized protein J4E92_010312 [Alternaria infectoria]|uniref:uncharacterized protein n=1 Tax=Alternaria infectoria TaxID=45303 RepID=UPI002220BC47|nr:uncharacterized protein J4E92_010312 [Alternaria infectoria]KAI4911256.1 hypothetical protein J4E92_010312 [Alternaria infectoria]